MSNTRKPTPSSSHRRAEPVVDHIVFENCERRLVLSAQLMFDLLGDQALELHGAMGVEANIPQPVDSIPIESHLREAHVATGWNSVQQQFGLTGKGQTVAVIDSGIAWDHVALGKGYGSGYRVVGGWDFTEENDAQPYDDGPMGFHGTHVSGIIGSDDPINTGVAPGADLVALRVFNDLGQGQLSWVERALQWVHDNRNTFKNPITTVNLSLGTTWNADVIPNWATLEEEFKLLYDDGIVVTASAGNSFQTYQQPGLSYPAASPYVLPVASVDDDGSLSDFSQRNSHVIAAPGRNILSTVPDHVLGRDGKIDDFTTASGTSMAAPYVAGASVLVRQAMQMVGYAGINLSSIASHLHATADSIFDAATGASYDRLNLAKAIDAIIPDDTIGNTLSGASLFNLASGKLDGWLNTLGDQDVYRFTAPASGTLQLDADSAWLSSLRWSVQSVSGQELSSGGLDPASVALDAGQTYNLVIKSSHEIGSFHFDFNFSPQGTGSSGGSGNGGAASPPTGVALDLGTIDYHEQTLAAGKHLRVQASHNGVFTVQWTNQDAQFGNLAVFNASGPTATDTTWENGSLRLDMDVRAGQWLDIQLPSGSSATDTGELVLANVLSRTGASLHVQGTLQSDDLILGLQNGLSLKFGQIEYAYPAGSIAHLSIDAHGGNDHIDITGSARSDKVDLRPTGSTIENTEIVIGVTSVEQVDYRSGGGADRIYLYDSDGDDTLNARPRSAELVGVGYRFGVRDVERIFIHATGGGQDFAYLYDSSADDRLSVRPQFSSMSGSGYFNYVRGFERVYAYANAGGNDTADLYDSSGNDRFSTSGTSASIVGPGFSSFTRAFEQVNALADSGGTDIATLYGTNQQTQWQQGSDFVRFRESGFSREARGFHTVETFVAGQAQRLGSASIEAVDPAFLSTAEPTSMPPSPDGSSQDASPAYASPAYASPLLTTFHDTTALCPTSQFSAGQATYSTVEDDPDLVLQRFESQAACQSLPELRVLKEVRTIADWLSERLQLPEENLLADPEQELAMLDEIFSRHD